MGCFTWWNVYPHWVHNKLEKMLFYHPLYFKTVRILTDPLLAVGPDGKNLGKGKVLNYCSAHRKFSCRVCVCITMCCTCNKYDFCFLNTTPLKFPGSCSLLLIFATDTTAAVRRFFFKSSCLHSFPVCHFSWKYTVAVNVLKSMMLARQLFMSQ